MSGKPRQFSSVNCRDYRINYFIRHGGRHAREGNLIPEKITGGILLLSIGAGERGGIMDIPANIFGNNAVPEIHPQTWRNRERPFTSCQLQNLRFDDVRWRTRSRIGEHDEGWANMIESRRTRSRSDEHDRDPANTIEIRRNRSRLDQYDRGSTNTIENRYAGCCRVFGPSSVDAECLGIQTRVCRDKLIECKNWEREFLQARGIIDRRKINLQVSQYDGN